MNAKTIIGFALGPLCSALLGVLIVPIVAWAFSPEDVGRLTLLQLALSFSLLVLVLGMDQAYVREFHESNDRNSLLKASFFPGFALLIAAIFVTAGIGSNLSAWIFGESNPWYYALTVVSIMAAYISRFLSLILRMNGRGLAFSMSQIIPKVLQLFLLGLVILLGWQKNFLTLLLISMVATLAVVPLYAWNTRYQWASAISASVSVGEVRALLKFGLPLVLSALAYWGLTAISALVLRSKSTLAELGIYSVASSFAAAAAIFQSIFSVIWAPTVYKWVADGVDMARVDAVARQALAAVCLIFAMIGSFSWVIDYLLPAHYRHVRYLLLCSIVPPLLYVLSEITSVGIGISRRTTLTIWVTIAALLTNGVLNLWLTPTRGAAGAVIANVVAYVVYFVGRTEASAYAWRQFPRAKLYFFVGLISFLAIFAVENRTEPLVSSPLIWLALLPLFVWCFRSELFEICCSVNLRKLKN